MFRKLFTQSKFSVELILLKKKVICSIFWGGRSSRDDDDEEDGRGSGRGWFDYPEGHVEAARRRSGGRSRSSSGGGRSSSSRRGRSTSSSSGRSRGNDNDGRGWHGDPRGHAQTAERGWRSRQ